MTNIPTISVCVCTFRRPELLLGLLESLAGQSYSCKAFEVVVVDNDRSATARPVIDHARVALPNLTICYEVEPTSGVSFARNRSVALARGRYLAFIDDDEYACANWLKDLEATLLESGADAVLGPVIPVFPSDSPKWTMDSGFFERPRFATGTKLGSGEGRTSNALVLADLTKSRSPEAFAIKFARTGGEDHDFFKWLVAQGGSIVWCNSADVYETVPLARQTIAFILSRSFRTSVIYWQEEYALRPFVWSLLKAAQGAGGSIVWFLGGCLALPAGLARTASLWAKASRAAGRVGALFQLKPVGYGVPQ